MLPKRTTYVKIGSKYNTICDKVTAGIKKEFGSEPV